MLLVQWNEPQFRLSKKDSNNIMRDKVDILPLQGRSQELLNPDRAKPEKLKKNGRSKKSDAPKSRKKSKK